MNSKVVQLSIGVQVVKILEKDKVIRHNGNSLLVKSDSYYECLENEAYESCHNKGSSLVHVYMNPARLIKFLALRRFVNYQITKTIKTTLIKREQHKSVALNKIKLELLRSKLVPSETNDSLLQEIFKIETAIEASQHELVGQFCPLVSRFNLPRKLYNLVGNIIYDDKVLFSNVKAVSNFLTKIRNTKLLIFEEGTYWLMVGSSPRVIFEPINTLY